MFTKIFAFAYRNWIFAKRNFFAFTEIVFWPFVSLVAIGLMGNFLDLKGNGATFPGDTRARPKCFRQSGSGHGECKTLEITDSSRYDRGMRATRMPLSILLQRLRSATSQNRS